MIGIERLLLKGSQLSKVGKISRCIPCRSISVQNEPVYAFEPGSKIRQDVQDSLASIQSTTKDIPIVIGGEEIYDGDVRYQVSPYNHQRNLASFRYATADMINAAINNAMAARRDWEAKPISDRAQIFLKAADILADKKRAEVLATTMAGQGKSIIQAEIDAGPELIDFLKFNVQYALDLQHSQPLNPDPTIENTIEYRGLEVFVH